MHHWRDVVTATAVTSYIHVYYGLWFAIAIICSDNIIWMLNLGRYSLSILFDADAARAQTHFESTKKKAKANEPIHVCVCAMILSK